MRINQNIAAFNAYRNLNQTQGQLNSSLEKLSSGFRINRAADDASGLVNSENLRSQIGGLNVASRNAQDAISMVQTAEGAQTEVHSMLQRMRDLVAQSGNIATNDEAALQANQDEIAQLKEELDRIADQTQFGTQQILNGDFAQIEAQDAVAAAEAELEAAGAADLDYSGGDVDVTVTVDGDASTVTLTGTYADADALVTALNADTTTGTWSHDAGVLTLTGEDASADGSISIDAGATELGFTDDTTASGTDAQDAVEAQSGAVFQVGANAGQTVEIGINSVTTTELGTGADVGETGWASVDDIDLTNTGAATLSESVEDALNILDDAISSVSTNRAELGAFQNRMESTVRNVSVAVENLSAAESRIRDTDMAAEMVDFTRHQILQQAGTSMLAQANQAPQSVLSLLG